MRYIALFLLSLVSSVAGLAQAQEPPGRVGRLAYTQGTVSVYQDPDLGWDKAYINTPVTSENSIWTERGSRAEMRVGSTAVRLAEATQLDVSRLDDDELDMGIERGAANIRVRYKQGYERITLYTPQARFTIQSDGRYRVDVDPSRDESRLTVFAGDARMESQSGSVRVNPGSTVRVFGGPSSSYVLERAASDAFDRWADARDREWSDSRARQFVSTEMTGYEDLDRYGQWSQDPDYGAVWFPTRVAADWAPYRAGHWSYVRPWGWTWVDDAPWGYAPFHYGRWVQVRDRWAWSPGQRVARPAWAPALVGFVGGSNWSVSVGSGASAPVVGWYPLAPWERYEPWYRSSRASTDRLNVVVRDRAPRQFAGRGEDWRRVNRDRGATVVQRDVLVDRRPVQASRVQVGVDALRQQQPVAAAQVQQVLPQGNELIRRRVDRPQAPVATPPVQQAQPAQQQRPQGGMQQAPGARDESRPNFARRGAPAPAPAPANQPPVQQAAPAPANPFNPLAPAAVNPASRAPAPQPNAPQQQQAREAQQAQERTQREAQQQQQAQERAQREAQQLQQQRQVRDAQQQQQQAQQAAQQAAQQQQAQERAQREAQQQQQNQLQQQRQVREAQQQQQQAQQAAQQAAQQQQAQERAQREAQQQQQNQLQQQRQVREAQQQQQQAQQAAQQQAQQAAQQAQQQQERAAREAQQQAQQAQQAAQQAQQAAQRAAQQAQQQQERAARGGQPPPQQPQAQPPAQPQAQPQAQQANPAARGNRDQKEKDAKDEKDKKDKEDKQR